MYKIKVIIDTKSDVIEFVNIANSIKENVYLEDGTHFRANAKSLMGVMYGTVEFDNIYVISDDPSLSSKFRKFIV